MRIAHIVECAGGVEKYLEMLIPLLKEKGYSQCLICSKNFSTEKFKNKADRIIITDMQQTFNPIKIFNICRQVKAAIKACSPDIIYCHSSFGGVYGRIAAAGSNSKCVYNPHGWAFNRKSRKSFIFKFIEKTLALYTNSIICISKAEMDSAINTNITNPARLKLITNGIDINQVANATPVSRKELGIDEKTLVVGMIGRVSPQKAPDTFIQAAKIIHDQIPNSTFIIVGKGEQEMEIKQLAKKNHIPLTITGWTEHPYAYLKIFDMAMLLSRWEGFGLAIAEYMAARKNFVATRIDAIPTLVTDRVDGILVDTDSPQQAADGIFWLKEHPEEASEMRQRAWKKVCSKYNISRVAEQHDELFQNLV